MIAPFEPEPDLAILEGFSSSAPEMDSKAFGFPLIYFLILSYAVLFSALWLILSVSLIFYFSFCHRYGEAVSP